MVGTGGRLGCEVAGDVAGAGNRVLKPDCVVGGGADEGVGMVVLGGGPEEEEGGGASVWTNQYKFIVWVIGNDLPDDDDTLLLGLQRRPCDLRN